jgi:hypothetical protein
MNSKWIEIYIACRKIECPQVSSALSAILLQHDLNRNGKFAITDSHNNIAYSNLCVPLHLESKLWPRPDMLTMCPLPTSPVANKLKSSPVHFISRFGSRRNFKPAAPSVPAPTPLGPRQILSRNEPCGDKAPDVDWGKCKQDATLKRDHRYDSLRTREQYCSCPARGCSLGILHSMVMRVSCNIHVCHQMTVLIWKDRGDLRVTIRVKWPSQRLSGIFDYLNRVPDWVTFDEYVGG